MNLRLKTTRDVFSFYLSLFPSFIAVVGGVCIINYALKIYHLHISDYMKFEFSGSGFMTTNMHGDLFPRTVKILHGINVGYCLSSHVTRTKCEIRHHQTRELKN